MLSCHLSAFTFQTAWLWDPLSRVMRVWCPRECNRNPVCIFVQCCNASTLKQNQYVCCDSWGSAAFGAVCWYSTGLVCVPCVFYSLSREEDLVLLPLCSTMRTSPAAVLGLESVFRTPWGSSDGFSTSLWGPTGTFRTGPKHAFRVTTAVDVVCLWLFWSL